MENECCYEACFKERQHIFEMQNDIFYYVTQSNSTLMFTSIPFVIAFPVKLALEEVFSEISFIALFI